MKNRLMLIALCTTYFLVLTLIGCQEARIPSSPNFDASTVVFPTVEPPTNNQGIVTGYVLLKETGLPIDQVAVQLAPVYRDPSGEDGVFVLNVAQSPYSETNELGWFAFKDIIPGEYVLIVGLVEFDDYYIIQDNVGNAIIWEVVANNIIDIGQIQTEPIQYILQRETFAPAAGYPAPEANQSYP